MIATLLLAAAAALASDCSPMATQEKINAAAEAMRADLSLAKSIIIPVLSCPPDNSAAYYAHVLRAEIAVREKDWVSARSTFNKVGFHPESKISVRAASFILQADAMTKNAKLFAADRAGIVAGNDAVLSSLGGRIETFNAGGAAVTAYETPVTQGSLHRVLEFIIVPDDASSYPRSILLTDDREAVTVEAELGQANSSKKIDGGHVWFIDAYDCSGHETLAIVPGTKQPVYEAVKVRVLQRLSGEKGSVSSLTVPDNGSCAALSWILPGLGARPS